MCNRSCIDFGKASIAEEDIRGKSVIEVGSLDINGSLRPVVQSFAPSRYIGVDIQAGRGVDQICRVEDLIATFGRDSFDLVICTELLEHVTDWSVVIHNLKEIVKPGGTLLITTRSLGFGYHGYPYDFWRYEISDMKVIFSDFDITSLQSDPVEPGVFMAAKKPADFIENNVKEHKLHSILLNQRSSLLKSRICRTMVVLPLYLKKYLPPAWVHAIKMTILTILGKTTISEIDLEFVNYCNLTCKWCSLDHHQDRRVMRGDLLRKFFDNLLFDRRFRSIKRINLFNGGETLLHPDFIGMMRIIKEYKDKFLAKGLLFPAISLLTNGTVLHKDLARELVGLDVVDLIRFSVDGGSKDKFEELRKGASWDVVSENIRDFVKINKDKIKTGIICVIAFGAPNNTEWMDNDFKELLALVDNIELRYPHDWMGDVKVEGLKKVFHNYCKFLFHSLCVLPDGDVVVCCGDLNGKKGVVGNLFKEDLYRIYNSGKRRRMRYDLLRGRRDKVELCRNCSGYC